MKILLTGASGFIGTTLTPFLRTRGHQVVPLGRGKSAGSGPHWNPVANQIDLSGAEDVQAVVHLAGESIMGRWTKSKKRRIRQSRVDATRLLCEALVEQSNRPSVLVCASAIGYYGNSGDDSVDEASPAGEEFLASMTADWEAATQVASDHGIRVVSLRIGLVLSPQGGALAGMLPFFRFGMGGRVGSGDQWWSWIALDDLQGIILHALNNPTVSGPINAVAPEPVTNKDFTRTLAHVLKRPAFLRLPTRALKLLFGKMADATLLASTRVWPGALDASGYEFHFPQLDPALRHLLGR